MHTVSQYFVMLAAVAGALALATGTAPTEAQDGTCRLMTVTYGVNGWGSDALFQHSDLTAALVDASGNPNSNGHYLKVTRAGGERQPRTESFQPSGGVFDAIASGQTLIVPVNPANGQVSVLFNICWK